MKKVYLMLKTKSDPLLSRWLLTIVGLLETTAVKQLSIYRICLPMTFILIEMWATRLAKIKSDMISF